MIVFLRGSSPLGGVFQFAAGNLVLGFLSLVIGPRALAYAQEKSILDCHYNFCLITITLKLIIT